MNKTIRVDVLNIGDELLLGLRQNGHLTYLGRELARHGGTVQRNVVVRDNVIEIRESFLKSWKESDVVVTTGGLGPTADDLSREVIADALGLKLEFVDSVRVGLEERFARMGRSLSANNLRQCYVPEGAEVLVNHHGTAPGILLVKDGKVLVMLPGPSTELVPMFEEQVLPRLEEEGLLQNEEQFLQVRTFGIGESALENQMRTLMKNYPGADVAYCAHQGAVDLRFTANGKTDFCVEDLNELGEKCMEFLGENFVCFGKDSLADISLAYLRAQGRTIAVAESCTGGLLGSTFTDVPGASDVFQGGIVAYHQDIKIEHLEVPEIIIQQHGAVSAETAVAMATGVAEKFSADYGVSTTGYAGPAGGTPEDPVGTVYIGLHSPFGVWSHRVHISGNRSVVRQKAVNIAADLLRRKLIKYQLEEAMSTVIYSMGAGI